MQPQARVGGIYHPTCGLAPRGKNHSFFLAAADCSPEEVDAVEGRCERDAADVDTTWVDLATVHKLTEGVGFEYSKRSGPAVRQILSKWQTKQTDEELHGCQSSVGMDDLDEHCQPQVGQRVAQPNPMEPVQWTYGNLTQENVGTWLQQLRDGVDGRSPTEEQMHFLEAISKRCLLEAAEEQKYGKTRSEPLRALLHGVPGAGKSQTLHWLRHFFENVCRWSHQHEFAYLAAQNTQAAFIQLLKPD